MMHQNGEKTNVVHGYIMQVTVNNHNTDGKLTILYHNQGTVLITYQTLDPYIGKIIKVNLMGS